MQTVQFYVETHCRGFNNKEFKQINFQNILDIHAKYGEELGCDGDVEDDVVVKVEQEPQGGDILDVCWNCVGKYQLANIIEKLNNNECGGLELEEVAIGYGRTKNKALIGYHSLDIDADMDHEEW